MSKNFSTPKADVCFDMNDKAIKKKQDKKRKKPVKIVLDVLFYVIMALIIATLIYGIVLKTKGDQSFYVFGYRAMIVSSSSMSSKNPKYADFLEGHDEQMQIGDLVITRKLKASDDLDIYDIVTFIDTQRRTVIHRIVSTDYYGTVKVYRTRGDATTTLDAARARTQYQDIYVTNVKAVGKAIRFLQEPTGIIAIIIGAVLLFLIIYLIKTIIQKVRENCAENTPIVPPDEE